MKLFNLNLKRYKYENYNTLINYCHIIFQSISINLVVPFAQIFAKRLNASDNQIAMLHSLPAFFGTIAIILSILIYAKYNNKKKVAAICYGLTRFIYIIFMIIPFFPPSFRSTAFVFFYGLTSFPSSIANIGWQALIPEFFKDRDRAFALSKRNSIGTFTTLLVTLITGNLLHFLPQNDMQRMLLYRLFFFIAFIFGLIEIYIFYKFRLSNSENNDISEVDIETKKADSAMQSGLKTLKSNIKTVLTNKPFIDYVICIALFNIVWQMGWPVLFSYEYNVLHSNEFWTSLITIVSSLVQTFTYIFWYKFSKKRGYDLPLAISAFLLSLVPLVYAVSTHMYQIVLLNLLSGLGVSGINLFSLNNLYEVIPKNNKTPYITFFSITGTVTLIFTPSIGIFIKDHIGFFSTLILISILRVLASSLFFVRYKKNRAKSTQEQKVNISV